MGSRFSSLAVAATLAAPLLAAAPAAAQVKPDAPAAPDWAKPRGDAQRPERGERTYNLDTLFEALKIAPDEASAKAIEHRIWALWMVSAATPAILLMGRAKAAAEEKDYGLAIKLLDAVIEIEPDYAEGWNRRATVYYLQKDYRPLARRHSRSVGARAPPFRRAFRPRRHPAGNRRREARARSLSPRACHRSSSGTRRRSR